MGQRVFVNSLRDKREKSMSATLFALSALSVRARKLMSRPLLALIALISLIAQQSRSRFLPQENPVWRPVRLSSALTPL
jgi:hypothetical protein